MLSTININATQCLWNNWGNEHSRKKGWSEFRKLPNFKNSLVKRLLQLGYGWIITHRENNGIDYLSIPKSQCIYVSKKSLWGLSSSKNCTQFNYFSEFIGPSVNHIMKQKQITFQTVQWETSGSARLYSRKYTFLSCFRIVVPVFHNGKCRTISAFAYAMS